MAGILFLTGTLLLKASLTLGSPVGPCRNEGDSQYTLTWCPFAGHASTATVSGSQITSNGFIYPVAPTGFPGVSTSAAVITTTSTTDVSVPTLTALDSTDNVTTNPSASQLKSRGPIWNKECFWLCQAFWKQKECKKCRNEHTNSARRSVEPEAIKEVDGTADNATAQDDSVYIPAVENFGESETQASHTEVDVEYNNLVKDHMTMSPTIEEIASDYIDTPGRLQRRLPQCFFSCVHPFSHFCTMCTRWVDKRKFKKEHNGDSEEEVRYQKNWEKEQKQIDDDRKAREKAQKEVDEYNAALKKEQEEAAKQTPQEQEEILAKLRAEPDTEDEYESDEEFTDNDDNGIPDRQEGGMKNIDFDGTVIPNGGESKAPPPGTGNGKHDNDNDEEDDDFFNDTESDEDGEEKEQDGGDQREQQQDSPAAANVAKRSARKLHPFRVHTYSPPVVTLTTTATPTTAISTAPEPSATPTTTTSSSSATISPRSNCLDACGHPEKPDSFPCILCRFGGSEAWEGIFNSKKHHIKGQPALSGDTEDYDDNEGENMNEVIIEDDDEGTDSESTPDATIKKEGDENIVDDRSLPIIEQKASYYASSTSA